LVVWQDKNKQKWLLWLCVEVLVSCRFLAFFPSLVKQTLLWQFLFLLWQLKVRDDGKENIV